MRQTIKEIEVNMAYRWFIGYDLNEKVLHFSTFGKNYTRRFKDTDVFKKIFKHILEEAIRVGFIDTSAVLLRTGGRFTCLFCFKFLENINNAKVGGHFEIYGYCLMDNHVHMLLKENEEIGISIKRITVGYVGWHVFCKRNFPTFANIFPHHLVGNFYISTNIIFEF